MKILISGISGFVGEYLANQISERNPQAEIFGIERNIKPFTLFPELNTKIKVLNCDITDSENVDQTISEISPDQFYHLAGFSSANTNDKNLVYKINVDGTENILKALAKLNKSVSVLLISTSYVYGNTSGEAEENDAVAPHGIYAESKAEMEKLAEKYQNTLKIMIARPVNHTGPGQKRGFVIPDFASQIISMKKGEEILVGNLVAERDFLDVRDVVGAYTLIMEKGAGGEIYNISSGKCQKIETVLDLLIKLSGKDIHVKIDPGKVRPVDIKKNCLNPAKIEKLGWHKTIELEKTLSDVLKYWEK